MIPVGWSGNGSVFESDRKMILTWEKYLSIYKILSTLIHRQQINCLLGWTSKMYFNLIPKRKFLDTNTSHSITF